LPNPAIPYTPLKHPGCGVSHSGLFVRGCCVVLYEDSCTSVRGLSGGSVTPHPVALMSHPWAQRGSPYPGTGHRVRVSLAKFVFRRLWFIEATPTAVTGPVLISWCPVWGSRSGGGLLFLCAQRGVRHCIQCLVCLHAIELTTCCVQTGGEMLLGSGIDSLASRRNAQPQVSARKQASGAFESTAVRQLQTAQLAACLSARSAPQVAGALFRKHFLLVVRLCVR
jgi:hypothetical protein